MGDFILQQFSSYNVANPYIGVLNIFYKIVRNIRTQHKASKSII